MTLGRRRRRRRRPGRPGRLASVVVVLAIVALSGCQVRTEISLDVEADGSGEVTVAIGLDDGAFERVPGIEQELRLDDLEAMGWTVTGPVEGGDGFRWFRASKPFSSPEEATAVLGEVTVEEGPFRDFRLTSQRSFARTDFEFEGTVDFSSGSEFSSGGLEGFGDEELSALLEGEPLGEDVAAIEERFGDSIDRIFQFEVAVRLPGDVASNAPGTVANGAVWEPTLSSREASHLQASSRTWRVGTLAWLAGAGLALLALIVLLAARLVQNRRQ